MCSTSHSGTVTVNVMFCKMKPTVPTLYELAPIPPFKHLGAYKLTILPLFPCLILSIIMSVQLAPNWPNPKRLKSVTAPFLEFKTGAKKVTRTVN